MKRKARSSSGSWEAWMNASFQEMLRFKWQRIMEDKRLPVLWIVEVLLAVSIAVSIALYLDPDVNVLPSPWNYAAFVILAGVALLIYRRTRPFRVSRRLKNRR